MTPNQDDRVRVPKDEPEFEAVEVPTPKRHRGRWLTILIILIAGAGWYYLGNHLSSGRQKGVPVVRADVSPVKIKPADPGGLDVPDRDKLVYDRLNGGGAGTEVESLLPPPEEPIAVPLSVQTPTVPETSPVPETSISTLAPKAPPPPVPETSISTLAPKAPPPPVPETSISTLAPKAPPPPVPTPTVTASTSGQFRIQLAALRTHGSAESEWKRLKNAHPDILGPLTLFVVMADLGGDQGIYYRLRAGNLNTKETAKAVCDKLAAHNVTCLVIRPGE